MRSRFVSILSVFRKGDPDAIVVLRMLAAVNDLGTLLRMIRDKQGTKPENAAAYRYALRMGALHIDSVKRMAKHDLPRLVRRHFWRPPWADAREHSERLSLLLADQRIAAIIGFARNKFAGHYDADYFERALGFIDRGDLMELPGAGMHFNVCDILFDQILAAESHSAYGLTDMVESAGAALNAFMEVQKAMIPVVSALVWALYAEAEGK